MTYFNVSSQTFVANLNCSIHSNQSCTYMIVGEVRGMEDNTQTVEADGKEEIFSYKMTGLRPCTDYTAFIRADKDSLEVPFSTLSSNVQSVLLFIERNGSVSVQCVYAESSTANGCHVIFIHTISGRNDSFNIIGLDDKTIHLLNSGVYTVVAYDISDNGSIVSWTCVQPKQVYVSSITSATSSSGFFAVSSTSSSTAISSSTSVTTPSSTVITGTETNAPGNDDSSMVYVIASVVFILMIMLIITFTLCVVAVIKRKQKNKVTLSTGNSIEITVNNPAYGQIERTARPIQSVQGLNTNVNPAYETVVVYEYVM
ncbi:PREDICTED: uncharacterized protein LOC109587070 [Amphimedon queenslandica]|uniref:Uncharacterized protein n=1 Tax=Amphimedon queenslandica TaxID=400682 RepID=A0AAN0JPB3_AMPQE|nr:PREDICTED: uncharacterized protein LOC109587070 [Amphimedon queenslandica]|eukprot:XP_019858849.1 PREDICTED: uncharacterized protein LOC109587070 [Amphimedon queenslandica]